MPVLKFKNLEDLDRLEREGKGISWQFTPDKIYLGKALQFQIRIPFPQGCTSLRPLKRPRNEKGNGG